MTSKIEWTGMTWNPTLGCSKVSHGCDGCYAISVAHRGLTPAHQGLTIRRPGEKPDWTGQIRLLEERLDIPLRRRKPTTWFVDSMSDLFHEQVPVSFIQDVIGVMARCPQHTFQILTKRPKRAAHVIANFGGPMPLRNVWLGTSIESDRYAFRADQLRGVPTLLRFVSLEPLLGPLPSLDLTGIDWVIVGGESGSGARPMHPDWARNIRDRCIVAGIPFFYKQHGEWLPLGPVYDQREEHRLNDGYDETADDARQHAAAAEVLGGHQVIELEADGAVVDGYQPRDRRAWLMARVGKKSAGREIDGRTWDEMPTAAGRGTS